MSTVDDFNNYLVTIGIYPPFFWECVKDKEEVGLVKQKIQEAKDEKDFLVIANTYC